MTRVAIAEKGIKDLFCYKKGGYTTTLLPTTTTRNTQKYNCHTNTTTLSAIATHAKPPFQQQSALYMGGVAFPAPAAFEFLVDNSCGFGNCSAAFSPEIFSLVRCLWQVCGLSMSNT